MHARRAVERDKSNELVPGKSGRNGQRAPRENFVLVDERIARGKKDGDASLGAAPGARERRAGYKRRSREGRLPDSSVSKAPMCFLKQDGTSRLEPATNDAALVGRLVGVGRDHPPNVPGGKRGPSISATI